MAEFVIGTLPLDERDALRGGIAAAPAFTARVRYRKGRLAPMTGSAERVSPSAQICASIEARLFPPGFPRQDPGGVSFRDRR